MDVNEARCSFCHKTASAVSALIQAPKGYAEAYICTECIRACAAILDGEGAVLPETTKEPVQ